MRQKQDFNPRLRWRLYVQERRSALRPKRRRPVGRKRRKASWPKSVVIYETLIPNEMFLTRVHLIWAEENFSSLTAGT